MSTANEFCMPLLLRRWAAERATGTVRIYAPHPAEIVTTLLVENGVVVFATTRNRRDPTGELFLELFQLPPIDPESVVDRVQVERQVRNVVADLFNWEIATVEYQDGIHLTQWPQVGMSVADTLLRGMRRITDETRIASWLGSLDQVVRRSADPFTLFQASLRPEEAFLISRIDGALTIRNVVALAGDEAGMALRLVCALLFAGAVEVVDERRGAESWIGVRTDGDAVPHAAKRLARDFEIDAKEAARFWYQVEDKIRAIQEAVDYYALLEVERSAPVEAIRASYERLSRIFHPDRYSYLTPNHVDVDNHLDTIFRELTTASVILSDPEKREQYDQQLVRRAREQAVKVDPILPIAGSRIQRRPSVEQRSLVPVDTEGETSAPPVPAAEERSVEWPGVEPPQHAAPEPPEPPTGSHRGDPQAQAPRSASITPPPGRKATTGLLKASDWFHRGLSYAAAGDHERAVHAFERAILVAPNNARLLLAYGRSLAHLPGRHHQAEETFRKSIDLVPYASMPYVELGLMYKRLKRMAEARNALQQALSIAPNDERALAALTEIDGASKTSGFLKKLLRQ